MKKHKAKKSPVKTYVYVYDDATFVGRRGKVTAHGKIEATTMINKMRPARRNVRGVRLEGEPYEEESRMYCLR